MNNIDTVKSIEIELIEAMDILKAAPRDRLVTKEVDIHKKTGTQRGIRYVKVQEKPKLRDLSPYLNKIKQLKPGQLSTAKKKIRAGLMKLDENRPNYGKLVKEHLQLLEAIEKAESGYVKS